MSMNKAKYGNEKNDAILMKLYNGSIMNNNSRKLRKTIRNKKGNNGYRFEII